jgi:hypothetical protein
MGLDCLVSSARSVREGFTLVGPVLTFKISQVLRNKQNLGFQIGKIIDVAKPEDVIKTFTVAAA